MTSVINAAHRSGARVVLTVQSFAWTSSGLARQKSLLGSPTYRNRLARQIALAVRDRGADGVNLDFEPIASGYADEFTSLVRAVRSQLNRVHKGYQLTFDTTGWIGNYPIKDATARGAADAVVVMGYDYRTAGSSPVGSLAPIGGPNYDVTDTVAAFVARIPPSKVILGVPYYGRAWSTADSSLHSKNISGTKYGASVAIPYATAREFALAYGRKYDPVEGVSWIAYRRQNCTTAYGCVTPWRQLYYDDVTALKAKYDLVNRAGLRGVGIWALGYDGSRPELYAALKAKFITDKVPPVITAATISGARFSPDGNGHGDTVTMRLSGDGPRPLGLLGRAGQRDEGRQGDPQRAACPGARCRSRGPGPARGRRSSATAATASPCGPPTPRTTARQRSFDVVVDRRRADDHAVGRAPRSSRRASPATTAQRALRLDVERAAQRHGQPARPVRRGPPALDDRREGGVDDRLDGDPPGRRRSSATAATRLRVDGLRRGRQPDGPRRRRSSSTGRSARRRWSVASFDPRGKADGPGHGPAAPRRPPQVGDLPRPTARPDDLGRPGRAARRHRTADLGRQDGGRLVGPRPGPTALVVRATSSIGTTEVARQRSSVRPH